MIDSIYADYYTFISYYKLNQKFGDIILKTIDYLIVDKSM
jgi:hypothetical protein